MKTCGLGWARVPGKSKNSNVLSNLLISDISPSLDSRTNRGSWPPGSPLSAEIAVFIFRTQTWLLREQPSRGSGTPGSPLSAKIAVFIFRIQTRLLREQPSRGSGAPGSPLSAKIVVFMLEVQTWPLSILKNTILAVIHKVFCALMSFVIFRI